MTLRSSSSGLRKEDAIYSGLKTSLESMSTHDTFQAFFFSTRCGFSGFQFMGRSDYEDTKHKNHDSRT